MRGVVPSASVAFTSAPARMSDFKIWRWKPFTAMWRAVAPDLFFLLLTLAPPSRRRSTARALPFADASMSGVRPSPDGSTTTAFTLLPSSISSWMVAGWGVSPMAACRAVMPPIGPDATFRSAPYRSSILMLSFLPEMEAAMRGVSPESAGVFSSSALRWETRSSKMSGRDEQAERRRGGGEPRRGLAPAFVSTLTIRNDPFFTASWRG
mmetsp:Transcript_12508/g.33433  ORF Transcript_12508/g.33433 Transcript_12508/m.33433 type:complete len:209 (+) Transcript_12508:623-1249(+)